MISFKTLTGSIYSLDQDNNRIKRITGTAEPTSRQGIDGTWQEYLYCTDPEVGKPVAVTWSIVDGYIARQTITSTVTEIW